MSDKKPFNLHQEIFKFNSMYLLPTPGSPTLDACAPVAQRLRSFKKTLGKELDEIDGLIERAELSDVSTPYTVAEGDEIRPIVPLIVSEHDYERALALHSNRVDLLTGIADLLCDLQIYCASEMLKFGLPQEEIMGIIMRSNFSKLGADGFPIYNEDGKVQKGPNYYKPEPEIHGLIDGLVPLPVRADAFDGY